jgi:hypothetical protein
MALSSPMLERTFAEHRRDLPIYIAFMLVWFGQLWVAMYLEHATRTTDIGLGAVFIGLPLMCLMFAPIYLAAIVLLLGSPSLAKRVVWFVAAVGTPLIPNAITEDGLFGWYVTDMRTWVGFGIMLGVAGLLRLTGFSVQRDAEQVSANVMRVTISDLLWWMAVAALVALAWKQRHEHESPRLTLSHTIVIQTLVSLWFGLRRTSWPSATMDIICTSLALAFAWNWFTNGIDILTTLQILSAWLAQTILVLSLRIAGYRIVYRAGSGIQNISA